MGSIGNGVRPAEGGRGATTRQSKHGFDSRIVSLKRIGKALPHAFPDKLGHIPNNPITAAVLAAILKGGPKADKLLGGWRVSEDGRLVYRHFGKKGGEIAIYVKYAGSLRSLDQQWQMISSLTPLTADVLLIVLAQLCEPSVINKTRYPHMEPVTINSSAIMRYKNMVRWGAERLSFQDKIAEEMENLSRLRFDIIDFPAWDPKRARWNPQGITIHGDRILDVVQTVHIPSDRRSDGSDDHFWHVRLGQWGHSWMNAYGKVWLGPLPENLIQLDHRKNRGASVLAKKIGLSNVLLWGAVRSRPYLYRRIDRLLESVGELPQVTERSSHWAGRIFDRMTEASLMLHEQGVLTLTYEGGEQTPKEFDRYKKGWVKHWLGSKVRVERPAYFKHR